MVCHLFLGGDPVHQGIDGGDDRGMIGFGKGFKGADALSGQCVTLDIRLIEEQILRWIKHSLRVKKLIFIKKIPGFLLGIQHDQDMGIASCGSKNRQGLACIDDAGKFLHFAGVMKLSPKTCEFF